MEKTPYESRKSGVIDGLGTIHDALARAPQDEQIARAGGLRSAFAAATAAVSAVIGWKVFSSYSESTGNDFMRMHVRQQGPVLQGAVQIDTRKFFPRMKEGLIHVFATVRSPHFWEHVAADFRETYRKSPKTFGVIAGGIAALSAGAGIFRYFRERNRTRDARFREIGNAMHAIADGVREHPELLEDQNISGAMKERLASLSQMKKDSGWGERMRTPEESPEGRER